MANSEVSRLKFNNTTYDIADELARQNIGTARTEIATEAARLDAVDTALAGRITNLENSAGAVLVAKTKSAMSNTSKIYVYTGSESGMTRGNWYYHNGSAWVSGGAYNQNLDAIDATLTQSNKGADAKVTGDRLTAAETDISTLRGTIANEYASQAYAVGDYCYYNGLLYRCNTEISVGETWTSGHWTAVDVMPELNNLKNDMISSTSVSPFNILTYTDPKNSTNTGISFQFNLRDNKVILNGTLTSTFTFKNFYHDTSKLPRGIIAGRTYNVEFLAPDTRIDLQITFYNSNGSNIFSSHIKGKKQLKVPNSAIGANIRIYVYGDEGISRDYQNYEVEFKMYLSEYVIVSTPVDFNDLTENTTYAILDTNEHINCPERFLFGYVENRYIDYTLGGSQGGQGVYVILQKAYTLNTLGQPNYFYAFRFKVFTSGIWSDWKYVNTNHDFEVVNLLPYYKLNSTGTINVEQLSSTKYHIVAQPYTSTRNLTLFQSPNTLPENLKPGGRYYVRYKNYSNNSKLLVNVAEYYNNTYDEYHYIYFDYKTGGYFTISENATGFYVSIRLYKTSSIVDEVFDLCILNFADNQSLSDIIDSSTSESKYNVNVIPSKDSQFNYFIRSSYDETSDIVYSLGVPTNNYYNDVFSFNKIYLIPSDTAISDTKSKCTTSRLYKDASDEIPAMSINGEFVGSNHGDPRYTRVVCTHSLDETYIGTQWTDNNNETATLVNVLADSLIFGYLGNNNQLIVKTPTSLTYQSYTVSSISTSSYQLRRSAINKKYTITNNEGTDISFGGGGNNVIVTEDYDINDQSKGLLYLQQNVGNNTNSSYYDDGQLPVLGHITNTFVFNRNGSITCYGTLEAKETIVDDKIYGAMSLNFSRLNIGYDKLYVPDSGNCKEIKSYVGDTDAFDITLGTSEIMHHRYYQLSNNYHGHFLHILDLGCYDNNYRKSLSKQAYNSAVANKFYLNLTGSKTLNAGDTLSWGYGRGPFKYYNNITNLSWFDYRNGYIVAIDFHNDYSGNVKLPYYMAGKEIEILEKTESVTLQDTLVTNIGLRLNCTTYGYLVIYVH